MPTTKKELRDALADWVAASDKGDVLAMMAAEEGARAILARPARVTGYVVLNAAGVRVRIERQRHCVSLADAKILARDFAEHFGLRVRKLVIR